MDYANLNLREKTFLDFTKDEKLISEIIGDKGFFMSNITDENRANSFLYFADLTTDKKLADAINKEFESESALLFPE